MREPDDYTGTAGSRDGKAVEDEQETALSTSLELQDLILETAMDGFWLTDMQGRLLAVNESYCHMSGYDRSELLTMRIADLDAVETETDNDRHIQQVIRMGQDRFESRQRRKDGSLFDVEVSVQYHPVEGGRMVAFLRDISDRKRVQEEKIALEAQLQKSQKLEAIGTLAGGIAHDFNNILFPIIGRCEMLLDDLSPDSDFRRPLQSILDSATRASGLVKQILAFSRQAEVGKVPVRLQHIIEEVLILIRHSLPTTIAINLEIDESCESVMADEGQIHQVLMNLISNAYHAMESTGGKLEIGLRQVEAESIKVPEVVLPCGRYLNLYVSDTGTGIEDKIINRIFDPYFTTKDTGKGTGLGLTVSYGIIRKHGGLIHVDSAPGQGSTFHVYLPIMKTRMTQQTPEAMTVVFGGTERILLVDDEFEIVDTVAPMLERLGYQVTARTGSIEALADFQADPDRYDLLVTDMTMPGMTGVRLASEIHNIRPEFPVILCTGFSQQIDESNIGQMGINALVMKPIVRDQLASLIRKVLDSRDE